MALLYQALKFLFYLSTFPFIIYELYVLLHPRAYDHVASAAVRYNAFRRLKKQNPSLVMRPDDQEARQLVRCFSALTISYVVILLLGLFTENSVLYLLILLLFIIKNLLPPYVRNSRLVTIADSAVSFGLLNLAVANAYQLRLDWPFFTHYTLFS